MPDYLIAPKGLRARYAETGLPGASRFLKAFRAKDLEDAKIHALELGNCIRFIAVAAVRDSSTHVM